MQNSVTSAVPEAQTQRQIVDTILDAIPDPVFLVDADVRIIAANIAAKRTFGVERYDDLGRTARRVGEALQCIHALASNEGCGRTRACRQCAIHTAVGVAFARGAVYRARGVLSYRKADRPLELDHLVSAAPLILGGDKFAVVTLEDVTDLVQLKGLLPICVSCGRIRNDNSYWTTVARYLRHHPGVDLELSVCDKCMSKSYADEDDSQAQ